MQHDINVKWGSFGLVLALPLLMDASTSLPGNGQRTAPTVPSCMPEEHGGSSGSAPLGCLQVVLQPVPPWQGAAPGSVPHTSPAPLASQAAPTQSCPPSSLLSMSVPLQTARAVTLCECHEGTVTPESVTRALQTLVRGSINVNLHTLQFRCVLQLWT